MAANLQRAEYSLVIHNRKPEKAEELTATGATWASTAATVGRQVTLLFTVLADPEAVRASALDENGSLD
jgi:3-hydroxyisobutyrate dehydrogenase-like beta-hydroxyacid dehydrogenase